MQSDSVAVNGARLTARVVNEANEAQFQLALTAYRGIVRLFIDEAPEKKRFQVLSLCCLHSYASGIEPCLLNTRGCQPLFLQVTCGKAAIAVTCVADASIASHRITATHGVWCRGGDASKRGFVRHHVKRMHSGYSMQSAPRHCCDLLVHPPDRTSIGQLTASVPVLHGCRCRRCFSRRWQSWRCRGAPEERRCWEGAPPWRCLTACQSPSPSGPWHSAWQSPRSRPFISIASICSPSSTCARKRCCPCDKPRPHH